MMVTGAFVVAEHLVAERAGLHQVGFRHGLGERAAREQLEPAAVSAAARASEEAASRNWRRVVRKGNPLWMSGCSA